MKQVYDFGCDSEPCNDVLDRTAKQSVLLLEVTADLYDMLEIRIQIIRETLAELQTKITRSLKSRLTRQHNLVMDVVNYLETVTANRLAEQSTLLNLVAPGFVDLYQAEREVALLQTAKWKEKLANAEIKYTQDLATGNVEQTPGEISVAPGTASTAGLLAPALPLSGTLPADLPRSVPPDQTQASFVKQVCDNLPPDGMVCIKLFGQLCEVQVNQISRETRPELYEEKLMVKDMPELSDAFDDGDEENQWLYQ